MLMGSLVALEELNPEDWVACSQTQEQRGGSYCSITMSYQ